MSIRPSSSVGSLLTRNPSGALELIDERGVEALSMRGLGSRLGYEGMALYRYVDGRENLLEAVVHRLTGTLELPDDPGPWEDY